MDVSYKTDAGWPAFAEEVAIICGQPVSSLTPDVRPFGSPDFDSLSLSELAVFLLSRGMDTLTPGNADELAGLTLGEMWERTAAAQGSNQ
jgi:hypothetical protein